MVDYLGSQMACQTAAMMVFALAAKLDA
jgi:hypothetical protein